MKRELLKIVAIASLVIANISGLVQAEESSEPAKRWIEHVKGDVYLFQDSDNEWNTPHGAMFVVTSEGIVVTDPISTGSVEWLKAELKTRFNKPVTHMVYSHSHGGHNSGGQAWGKGVDVISHDIAKAHVEAGYTDTALPTMTFSEKFTFTTGDKIFEAVALGGTGHSEDLIAVVVRPENVAFVVDLVTPNRLPLTNFPETDIAGMINQLKAVEALDFELLAPGHGPVGGKADVRAQRVYIEELMAAVKAELKAGKLVNSVVEAVKMEKYKDWYQYDAWIELNVRGMAQWLQENGMR